CIWAPAATFRVDKSSIRILGSVGATGWSPDHPADTTNIGSWQCPCRGSVIQGNHHQVYHHRRATNRSPLQFTYRRSGPKEGCKRSSTKLIQSPLQKAPFRFLLSQSQRGPVGGDCFLRVSQATEQIGAGGV